MIRIGLRGKRVSRASMERLQEENKGYSLSSTLFTNLVIKDLPFMYGDLNRAAFHRVSAAVQWVCEWENGHRMKK